MGYWRWEHGKEFIFVSTATRVAQGEWLQQFTGIIDDGHRCSNKFASRWRSSPDYRLERRYIRRYAAADLRKHCPCATCREKRDADAGADGGAGKPKMLPVLSLQEARPLRVEHMRPLETMRITSRFPMATTRVFSLLDSYWTSALWNNAKSNTRTDIGLD